MRRLAIVPARGGSKRLPGKNVRLLSQIPLLNHTVDVARECFDHVIVSSDAADVLAVVASAANVETHLRPPELATDASKVVDTVSFYFDRCRSHEYEQIWLCLPSCPLRTCEDIIGGQYLLTPDVDGVVSVTSYEFPPSLALRIDQGLLKGLETAHPLACGNSRTQDQPNAYRPNGAFYGMWWRAFSGHRNFYRGKVRAYFMPRERSVDIDTELDIEVAEALISRRGPPPIIGN